MSFQRILVAVDDGPVSAHAADIAVSLAMSLEAELAFVHAFDPSIPKAKEDGRDLLRAFRSHLSYRAAALEFLVAGEPALQIINTAREWSADLIVMGSHGGGDVQSSVLGSAAEGIMRHARCPILVVRPLTGATPPES